MDGVSAALVESSDSESIHEFHLIGDVSIEQDIVVFLLSVREDPDDHSVRDIVLCVFAKEGDVIICESDGAYDESLSEVLI